MMLGCRMADELGVVGVLLADHLDRDDPSGRQLGARIDAARSALPEDAIEAVVAQGRAECCVVHPDRARRHGRSAHHKESQWRTEPRSAHHKESQCGPSRDRRSTMNRNADRAAIGAPQRIAKRIPTGAPQ
jgi:hypothetical protein